MISLQLKLSDGTLVTNRNYFPKDWKVKGQYRFVARDQYGDDFSSDGFRNTSVLMQDPLYVCKTSSDEYKQAADKRIFG